MKQLDRSGNLLTSPFDYLQDQVWFNLDNDKQNY